MLASVVGTSAQEVGPARVLGYDLDVRLEPDSHRLTATATVTVRAETARVRRLEFSLNPDLRVDRVSTSAPGYRIRHKRDEHRLEVRLHPPLARGEELPLEFRYGGGAQASTQFYIGPEGSFASWVQRHWYPLLLRGEDKAPGSARFDVPAEVSVVATGIPRTTTEADGRRTFTFRADVPSAFSFAAAEYAPPHVDTDGDLRLEAWLFREDAHRAPELLRRVRPVLELLSELFGGYPYERFSIAEVPSEVAGFRGTCEQGFLLLPKSTVQAPFDLALMAHEIGHIWWANLVGTRGTGDFNLDEGLARYSAAMALERLEGREAMLDYLWYGDRIGPSGGARRYFQLTLDGRDAPLARSLSDERLRNQLADTKGTFVLHMLRQVMGDEAFVAGLRRYARAESHRRADLDEFRAAMEAETESELGWFFEQWYGRVGLPDVQLTHRFVVRDEPSLAVRLRQTEPVYRLPVVVALQTAAGERRETLWFDEGWREFVLPTDDAPSRVVLDPDRALLSWSSYELRRGELGLIVADTRRRVAAGRFEQASRRLQEILERDPRDEGGYHLRVYYELAQIHLELGDRVAATAYFRQCLALPIADREDRWIHPWSYLGLARSLTEEDARRSACREAERLALAIGPLRAGHPELETPCPELLAPTEETAVPDRG